MKIEEIQMKPFACHQSSISCAHGCERCWFFKERWGVELRGVKIREGADLGKIYHKFQSLGSGEGQEAKVLAWVRTMQTDLMARVDKGEDLDGEMLRKANLLTVLYNKAHAMAKLFWERYPTPSYLKTIGTEIKHKVTIQDGALAGMVLEGTIDKLVWDTRNGGTWIRDHKSTGMKSLDVIFGGFVWSTQARMYRILALSWLKEKATGVKAESNLDFGFSPIKGFILDGILKPGIKLCKKDDKNAAVWKCSVDEAYLCRVKEWYGEKDEAAILSKAIMYNEPLYPTELRSQLLFMKELSGRDNNPSNYERDPSRFHCYLYDSQCIYHDLCSSPIVKWEELFDNKYQIRKEEQNENITTNS